MSRLLKTQDNKIFKLPDGKFLGFDKEITGYADEEVCVKYNGKFVMADGQLLRIKKPIFYTPQPTPDLNYAQWAIFPFGAYFFDETSDWYAGVIDATEATFIATMSSPEIYVDSSYWDEGQNMFMEQCREWGMDVDNPQGNAISVTGNQSDTSGLRSVLSEIVNLIDIDSIKALIEDKLLNSKAFQQCEIADSDYSEFLNLIPLDDIVAVVIDHTANDPAYQDYITHFGNQLNAVWDFDDIGMTFAFSFGIVGGITFIYHRDENVVQCYLMANKNNGATIRNRLFWQNTMSDEVCIKYNNRDSGVAK